MFSKAIAAAWVGLGAVLIGLYGNAVVSGHRDNADPEVVIATSATVALCALIVLFAIRAYRNPTRQAFLILSLAGCFVALGGLIYLLFEGGELGIMPVLLSFVIVALEVLTVDRACREQS